MPTTLNLTAGATLPAIPGFVSGIDHDRDGNPVALRVIPQDGPCRLALNRKHVFSIRIPVGEGVAVRTGDEVLIPSSTIRRVAGIQRRVDDHSAAPDENGNLPKVLEDFIHTDAAGNPVLENGKPTAWLSVQVSFKDALRVATSRLKATQVAEMDDDAALASANAAWA